MTIIKREWLIAGSVAGAVLLATAGFFAAIYLSMTSTVMTKCSPDRRHTATLTRVDGIDVIFKVTVDGRRVYFSPDFAPVHADFRENLIWDTQSRVVVLEIGGQRIFGYDVNQARALTDVELSEVKFIPFEYLGFEGTLPDVGTAR